MSYDVRVKNQFTEEPSALEVKHNNNSPVTLNQGQGDDFHLDENDVLDLTVVAANRKKDFWIELPADILVVFNANDAGVRLIKASRQNGNLLFEVSAKSSRWQLKLKKEPTPTTLDNVTVGDGPPGSPKSEFESLGG